MKAQHIILMIACGFCLEYGATLSMAVHHHASRLTVVTGIRLKIGSIFLLAFKITTYDGFRKFMNS